ncbi:2-hydroxyacid dehydrogenase [Anaerobacillus sp. MEB173]|uniref:2-hydroxyacid dehydrogenase n=1 Tax=Anaerobacillus sp. MEB173 TaxID=3383345 RepID=UPI003F911FBD
MKIVITRKIPNEIVQLLEQYYVIKMWGKENEPMPRELLLEEVADADAVFTNVADQINQEFFEHAPKLKTVCTMAVGFDNIDVQEATNRGISIGHTPGVLTEATADLTFALLMATARRIVEGMDYLRQDQWTSWGPMLLTGQSIYGKTIGIIGMGRIGEAVARRASGFSMDILYHNRMRKHDVEDQLGVKYCSLVELLKQSDYVVLLTPSTPETAKMIGAKQFELMKKSAIFINTSRGTNVDEEALYRALKEGEIFAAGLDVFEKEPISSNHPLVSLDNVVLIPHIGSATIETRMEMAMITAKNILRALSGEKLLHTVNPEVYERINN